MRRTLPVCLLLIGLAWISGCGSSAVSTTAAVTPPTALNGQYAFVLSGFDSTPTL